MTAHRHRAWQLPRTRSWRPNGRPRPPKLPGVSPGMFDKRLLGFREGRRLALLCPGLTSLVFKSRFWLHTQRERRKAKRGKQNCKIRLDYKNHLCGLWKGQPEAQRPEITHKLWKDTEIAFLPFKSFSQLTWDSRAVLRNPCSIFLIPFSASSHLFRNRLLSGGICTPSVSS